MKSYRQFNTESIESKVLYRVFTIPLSFDSARFTELRSGKLTHIYGLAKSIVGIKSFWNTERNCLLIMKTGEVEKINRVCEIQYTNADYLASSNFAPYIRIISPQSYSNMYSGSAYEHELLSKLRVWMTDVRYSLKPGTLNDFLREKSKDMYNIESKNHRAWMTFIGNIRTKLGAKPINNLTDFIERLQEVIKRDDGLTFDNSQWDDFHHCFSTLLVTRLRKFVKEKEVMIDGTLNIPKGSKLRVIIHVDKGDLSMLVHTVEEAFKEDDSLNTKDLKSEDGLDMYFNYMYEIYRICKLNGYQLEFRSVDDVKI